MLRRILLLAALAICVLFAAPTAASAETWYVDEDTGDDSAVCNVPTSPCETVQKGIESAADSDTVQVDGGTYTENTQIAVDITLLGQEFTGGDGATEGRPVIDGDTGTAVSVINPGGATITGFTLLGNHAGVILSAEATVTGNGFTETADSSFGIRVGGTFTAGTIISGNTFTDDTTAGEARVGVELPQEGSTTISGNTFTNLSNPIYLGAGAGTPGSPVITGNEISGTRQVLGGGVAIDVLEGTPVIEENHIHSPIAAGATGIRIVQGSGSGTSPTGATLRRNRILGHLVGVDVLDTIAPVSLHSDVIANSGDTNLQIWDQAPAAPGVGDVSATNVTITGSNTGIYLNEAVLTLDSSIVGNQLNPIFNAGGGTCAITNSRGPTTTPGGDNCQNFQTSDDPMLAPDGYRLLAGSPMIDAGDPAAPLAPNTLDIDGDPRALDGTPACSGDVARRDIGADEYVGPAATGCDPAVQPAQPQKKKRKCKKKKKKKKVKQAARAAKKKCKKKGGKK